MTFLTRLVRQPQSLWIRKAIFQVHLWSGIALALYVLVISVTGSAIVFRRQMARSWGNQQVVVAVSGPRLTGEQIEDAARRAHPGYAVKRLVESKRRDVAAEVLLAQGRSNRRRLIDPYTGQDLGNAIPFKMRMLGFLVDLHDDLLGGRLGRKANGVGGALVLVLGMSGLFIWWRGVKQWWRGLMLKGSVSAKRLNFDLHSAIGFWTFGFLFMWAFTSLYLAFPEPFDWVVDLLEPPAKANGLRYGDIVLEYVAKVHIGRWAGDTVSMVWAVVGITPAILTVTGTIMWWNRVIRPASRRVKAAAREDARFPVDRPASVEG